MSSVALQKGRATYHDLCRQFTLLADEAIREHKTLEIRMAGSDARLLISSREVVVFRNNRKELLRPDEIKEELKNYDSAIRLMMRLLANNDEGILKLDLK